MSASSFPEDVKQFIERNLDSLEELEVLLFLHRQPSAALTAEALATAIYTNPTSTHAKLRALQHKGLVEARESEHATTFQYLPSSPKARFVDRLATLYAERRVAVTNIIISKPLPNIQAFADAFDFRKKRED